MFYDTSEGRTCVLFIISKMFKCQCDFTFKVYGVKDKYVKVILNLWVKKLQPVFTFTFPTNAQGKRLP